MKNFKGICFVILGSLVSLSPIGCGSDNGGPTTNVVRHPGVYVRGSSTPDKMLTLPYVDGWNVQTFWPTLEPEESQYDWLEVDGALEVAREQSLATGLDKRISVEVRGIGGSVDTPSWVFDLGISKYYWIDPNPKHDTFGECLVSAIPWDSIYLLKREAFIRAMGEHYTNERPDLLPYLSYMQGTSEAVTNGWGLPETIYTDSDCQFPTAWDTLGYSSQKIIDAFKRLAQAMFEAFPDTPVWVEVGDIRASIDSNGPTYVAEQITAWGFATYGQRFGVWREDIGACIPNPPTSGFWKILYDHPGQNGAETEAGVSVDDGDRLNVCNIQDGNNDGKLADDVLMQMVQAGLDYGMNYIEFNATDVKSLDPDLKTIFEYAHNKLTQIQ